MLKSVDEAIAVIRRETRPLGTQSIPLAGARGHVLAEAILLGADAPPFDRALLDGFAVRSVDAREGASLHIIGRQDAGGAAWRGVLQPGECIGINTGGILPAGADAVLMVEQSQVEARKGEGGEWVKVLRGVKGEEGIQRRGAHARAGAVAVPAGARLNAAALAAVISAGAGAAPLKVWRRPRVAVLSTGDELVPAGGGGGGGALGAGQIYNSNGPMLLALACESGCEVIDMGTVGDERAALRERLARGVAAAEVLIVTGGMSMGTRDLVPALLKELGVAVQVEKVRMKPGKPFVFGTLEGAGGGRTYVAGLPGNPVSAFVTFHLFVREMLAMLGGEEVGGGARGSSRWIAAEAGAAFEATGDREFFQPCVLRRRGGGGEGRERTTLFADPIPWRGSADIFSLSVADGLVRRPANAGVAPAGSIVEILPLNT